MYQWNEEHQCYVDEMGLPLSLSDNEVLMKRAAIHAKRSPEQLLASWQALLQELHPSMVGSVSKSLGSMK